MSRGRNHANRITDINAKHARSPLALRTHSNRDPSAKVPVSPPSHKSTVYMLNLIKRRICLGDAYAALKEWNSPAFVVTRTFYRKFNQLVRIKYDELYRYLGMRETNVAVRFQKDTTHCAKSTISLFFSPRYIDGCTHLTSRSNFQAFVIEKGGEEPVR